MNKQSEDAVYCRIEPGLWFIAVVWVGFIAAIAAMPFLRPLKASEWAPWLAMLLLCGVVPLIATALPLLRIKIRASNSGLSLHGLFCSEYIRWDEVTDYYFLRRDKALLGCIEFRGRVWKINPVFRNQDELREFIQSKANASRTTEWAILGARACDEWPRTFRYRDTNIPLLILTSVALTIILFALQISKGATSSGYIAMWNGFVAMWSSLSVWGRIGFVITFIAVTACYPTLFLAVRLPLAQATKRFLNQTVTADLRAITFQTPQEHVQISWDKVLDYNLDPLGGALQNADRCVVVTARGEQAFLSTIADAYTLKEIIKKQAINVGGKEWAYKTGRSREELKAPSSFVVPPGAKSFHFRTRTNRAMLVLLTFMGAMGMLPIVLGTRTGTDEVVTAVVITSMAACGAFLGWLSYFRTYVLLDNRGLTTHGWRGSRFIAWTEIEKYEGRDGYVFTIEAIGQKIRIWQVMSDVGDFKREVQIHAINSRNKTWENAGKGTTKRSISGSGAS